MQLEQAERWNHIASTHHRSVLFARLHMLRKAGSCRAKRSYCRSGRQTPASPLATQGPAPKQPLRPQCNKKSAGIPRAQFQQSTAFNQGVRSSNLRWITKRVQIREKACICALFLSFHEVIKRAVGMKIDCQLGRNQVDIPLDHFQRRMAKNLLEAVNVPAVLQVPCSKGVA